MTLPTFEEILQYTATNMCLLGLPIERGCPVTILFFLYFVNLLVVIIEEIAYVASRFDAEHFLEITAVTPCMSIGTLCLYKAFALFLNRKRIIETLNSFRLLYSEILLQDCEVKEVEIYVNYAKYFSKYFFILNQVFCWVYTLAPTALIAIQLFSNDNVELLLSFNIVLPFEFNTWKPWLVVFVHTSIAAVTTVLYLVAMDTLYCVLIIHVCINFSVLSYKIERLTPDNSNDLAQIVKQHQNLIKLSQDLEEIFAPSLLLNFVASSIEICMQGFNIVAGDLANVPSCCLFLSSALVQIFMLCLFGDLLITESGRLGQAAYMNHWVDMDQASKKSLMVLRERTLRPQRLTAMKFAPISYASFSKIISTSWSYFTILYTVYTRPDAECIH